MFEWANFYQFVSFILFFLHKYDCAFRKIIFKKLYIMIKMQKRKNKDSSKQFTWTYFSKLFMVWNCHFKDLLEYCVGTNYKLNLRVIKYSLLHLSNQLIQWNKFPNSWVSSTMINTPFLILHLSPFLDTISTCRVFFLILSLVHIWNDGC